MTLNDQIVKKAKQTRQEAETFESSLATQFKDLKTKSNENVNLIEKQVDILEEVNEIENNIANEIASISTLFSKNGLLENLVYAKIQEKLSAFPKADEEVEISPPAKSKQKKDKPKKDKKPGFSIPFLSPKKAGDIQKPPQKLASGGITPGSSQVKQKVKQNLAVPYADTLKTTLQASGIFAVNVLGEFISATGGLGGFFAPYLNSIAKPFALALGVNQSIINSLLGRPVAAATLNLRNEQRYFGMMWGKFLNDPTFVDKYIDRESGADAGPPGPSSPDFWLLAVAAMFENSHPQGAADVAQAIYNRLSLPGWGKTIKDLILAPDQFQPVRDYGGVAEWSQIKDESSAKAFIKKHGKSEEQLDRVVEALRDPAKQSSAASFVGARDNFRADAYEASNNHLDDASQVSRHGHTFGVEPGGLNYNNFNAGKLKPGPVPSFYKGGQMPSVAPTTSFILGPKSGYPVSLDGGETTAFTGHGYELISGDKVYPIDTPAYNLFVDKKKTFTRWAEIYYNKSFDFQSALKMVTSTSEVKKPEVKVNYIPGDAASSSVSVSSSSSSAVYDEYFDPHLFREESLLARLR